MTTAFISHPVFRQHEVPAGHPECPQRVAKILDELKAQHLYPLLAHYEAIEASREQLERVHSGAYLDELAGRRPGDGLAALDPDTYMGPHTLSAARHGAGAAVLATGLVLEERAENAFCCLRPPGHHAGRESAMGFCFVNNVAVGAAHALAHYGLERVAILDFDVHHGNGTEDIFRNDPRVLLCSTFQHPFYPFTGADVAAEHIVNVPLPAGSDGDAMRRALHDHWQPALEGFAPQCLFVSAGFDAHLEDPLAQLRLTDADYARISDWIVAQAERHAAGRIVSCLEGGYALAALARSAAAHVRSLARL